MVKTNKSEDDRPPVEFRVAHGLALFYIPTRLLSWVLSHFMPTLVAEVVALGGMLALVLYNMSRRRR